YVRAEGAGRPWGRLRDVRIGPAAGASAGGPRWVDLLPVGRGLPVGPPSRVGDGPAERDHPRQDEHVLSPAVWDFALDCLRVIGHAGQADSDAVGSLLREQFPAWRVADGAASDRTRGPE